MKPNVSSINHMELAEALSGITKFEISRTLFLAIKARIEVRR